MSAAWISGAPTPSRSWCSLRSVSSWAGQRRSHRQVPALVHVVVGIDTLLGADQEPAELRGIGPITAGTGTSDRATGATRPGGGCSPPPTGNCCTWTRTPTGPPPACNGWYGCGTSTAPSPPAPCPRQRCDLDHITAFNHHRPENGGASVPENLHALCRRHHLLKTAGAWKVRREEDGKVLWTAPTGHRYVTRPESYAT